MVHQRQAEEQAGVAVTFTEGMKLTMKKSEFSGKQYQQAAVHQHAWQPLGEEMQSISCIRRSRCAHCTESGEIGHINGHCNGW